MVKKQQFLGANLLRDTTGCVKLTDLGVSTEVTKMSMSKATKTTAGTLFWMAPEVINGEAHNSKIDIWYDFNPTEKHTRCYATRKVFLFLSCRPTGIQFGPASVLSVEFLLN